jgi:hypothetical protein
VGLLCVILALWRPLDFAAEVMATLPSLGMRGPVAAIELIAHGAVAALCVTAAMALWGRQPHGVPLARAAVVLSAAVSIQSLYWSILPSQTKPGDELPLAVLAVAHAAAWLLFLARSAHVRS